MSMEPPRKLGKYELKERLGRGGMAEVWKALDTQLQRYVAIKLLHTSLQNDANFVSRFQREAQVIASLHHPNIVQIHDFQVEQSSPEGTPIFYMVMAYIEGRTLADYIAGTSAQGKIPSPIEVVNLFTSISLAVDYAHQKGMIHRDIKPANILLDQHNRARNPMGEPILTDFGLAKLLGVSAVTLTGTQMGTPLYTSPEQARGYPGNERSDLYSLGVILYEIVTGTAPFHGDGPTAVLAQHLFATPTAPVLLNPNIPPALTMVIMTALAKDPNARFSRAITMAAAIAEALSVPLPESLGQPAFPPDIHSMPTSMGMQAPLSSPGRLVSQAGVGASPSSVPTGAPASITPGPASEGSSPSNAGDPDVTLLGPRLSGSLTPDKAPSTSTPSMPAVQAPVTPALWAANPPSWAESMVPAGVPQGSSPMPTVSGAPPMPPSQPPSGGVGGPLVPGQTPMQASVFPPMPSGPVPTFPPAAVVGPVSGPVPAIPPVMPSSPGNVMYGQVAPPPFAPAPPLPPDPASSSARRRREWRGLYTILIVLLLFVLSGAALGSYFLFFHNNAPAASSGGQVFFVSSGQFEPQSAQGIADELEFSLHNLPAPQDGQAYYAWLLADRHPQAEAAPMEPPPQFTLPLKIGPLPFSDGSINYLYRGTAAHDNLLSLASRLLITEEDTAGQQLGPAASRSAWRYYAEIPQTPYGNPALSALDHIRHLFYKETKVAVLGEPGGLDVWLFRNTEKVFEWSVSARDDYSPTMTDPGVIRGLFGDLLEYLDGSPNVSIDLPPGTTIVNPDPVASRVALLSVTPAQQQQTDLGNNPPGYIDHFALHLNGVVGAPDATPQMRLISTQIIEALDNAKVWLQQVRTDAKQLIAMDLAQLVLPSTKNLLDNMLQSATYAYVGQLDPKTNQVVPGVLQVHYDVQQLAALTVTTTLPQNI